jgi:hypothetical protein
MVMGFAGGSDLYRIDVEDVYREVLDRLRRAYAALYTVQYPFAGYAEALVRRPPAWKDSFRVVVRHIDAWEGRRSKYTAGAREDLSSVNGCVAARTIDILYGTTPMVHGALMARSVRCQDLVVVDCRKQRSLGFFGFSILVSDPNGSRPSFPGERCRGSACGRCAGAGV